MSDAELLKHFVVQARADAVARPRGAGAGASGAGQSRPAASAVQQFVSDPKAEAVDQVRATCVSRGSEQEGVEFSSDQIAAALRTVYLDVRGLRDDISAVVNFGALSKPEPEPPLKRLIRFLFQGKFPYATSHMMLQSKQVWWADKGDTYLFELLGEAKRELAEADKAAGEERMAHLLSAADTLGIAAVAADVVFLLVQYLEILKIILDESADWPNIRAAVNFTIVLYFDEIEPFMNALIEDNRDLMWRAFEASKDNLEVAREDYLKWRATLNRSLKLRDKASALLDAAQATLAVYDAALLLTRAGPTIMSPPRLRPALAGGGIAGAGVAIPTLAAVAEHGALLVVFSVGRFGPGRRAPRPPAVDDPRLPRWLRDWLRRFLARYPKMDNFVLRAIKRNRAVPGLFDEEIFTGTPEYSFDVTNARGGKIQIDGFDEFGRPIEVRLRETGRTLRGGEPLLGDDPDVLSLMRGEPTRSALARQEQLVIRIKAELRVELETRNQFLQESGLPGWNYITNSRWYHDLLEEVIIEKRLSSRFPITLVE